MIEYICKLNICQVVVRKADLLDVLHKVLECVGESIRLLGCEMNIHQRVEVFTELILNDE